MANLEQKHIAIVLCYLSHTPHRYSYAPQKLALRRQLTQVLSIFGWFKQLHRDNTLVLMCSLSLPWQYFKGRKKSFGEEARH